MITPIIDQVATVLHRRSRRELFLIGLAMALIIAALDYLTRYNISFSFLYLMPILLVTWFGGIDLGITFSIISAFSVVFGDVARGYIYPHFFLTVWNLVFTILMFILISFFLWSIKAAENKYKDLIDFIVHDFKNYLTSISLSFETLAVISKDKTGDQQKILDLGTVSSKRTFMLIDSILDISRIQGKKMPVKISKENIKDIAESSIKFMSDIAERNKISLVSSYRSSVETINTDKSLLSRILLNLTNNALKISPEGSSIEIDISDGKKNGEITISVTDHGPGISREMADKVFNKFAQFGEHKTGKLVGSGIGLAFCKAAVEALGGKILINSKEGQGTTFSFSLPA